MDGSGTSTELPAAPAPPAGTTRFQDALRTRAFATFFVAELQSVAGDQLARVALSVLVFQQTGSATASGFVFAATFLPAIVGGALLGPVADRYRRRWVMCGVDGVRAALFGAMALPGMPTTARVVLLVAAVFVGPLFTTAGVAYLAAALDSETFRVATGLRMLSSQAAQVVGFGVGGALVATLGPSWALMIDASTFALSALLMGVLAPSAGDERRRAAEPAPSGPAQSARSVLWADRRVRALLALSALAGFFIAPEGLAIPVAQQWHVSTTRAGLLLAAIPLGSVVGVYVLVRRVPRGRRTPVAYAMAAACGLPLVVSGVAGQYAVAVACWFVSGALAAYQVEVLTQIVLSIPQSLRGRGLGVANAVLLGAQGVGLAVFGGLGDALTPGGAIVLAGAAGAACAGLLLVGPLRSSKVPASPTSAGRG